MGKGSTEERVDDRAIRSRSGIALLLFAPGELIHIWGDRVCMARGSNVVSAPSEKT